MPRRYRVVTKLTEREYDLLQSKMNAAGITEKSAYLRKIALRGYIIRVDFSELREISRLLAINANNINQIAMRANESRSVSAGELERLKDEVAYLRKMVSGVMKSFGELVK